MRALVVTAMVLIVGLAACDSSGVPEPGDIDTCEDLAAATADLLQAELDVVAGLDLDAFLAEPGPPELEALEATGDALTARAAAIGCTPAEMSQLFREASEGLDADGPIADRFLEAIRARLGVEP
jgi:hypothetical protein